MTPSTPPTTTPRPRRVVLAGDSAVAPHSAADYPVSGWGAHLGAALTARCTALSVPRSSRTRPARGRTASPPAEPLHVIDLAQEGATTASHREEGLWAAVLEVAGPGDVVLLQFGHHDQAHDDLAAWGGFSRNLERMVEEVRAAGAHPVLCTPVTGRHFAGGRLVRTPSEHPAAVFAIAEIHDAPVLDLRSRTRELIEAWGEGPSRLLFAQWQPDQSIPPSGGIEDGTRFSIDGAIAVAEIVAELLAPVMRALPCRDRAGAVASAL